MTTIDHANMSATELARAIRNGQTTSAAATQAAMQRLSQADAAFHAIVSLERDAATQAAQAADDAVKAGTAVPPLHGVPVAHKDMFERTGKVASWGGNIQSQTPASQDATVIARLRHAGTHQIAALQLTEFAFGPTGHNYVKGHPRNPHAREHITGGSSSGSAIAVATGAVPIALGSDTAGSLRLPAAACGIQSLKPTWTRVSRAGCMPLSGGLDCVGPIARCAADLAASLQALAGHDPRDGLSSKQAVPDFIKAATVMGADGLRIAVADNLNGHADPWVQSKLTGAIDCLRADGCEIQRTRIEGWTRLDHLTQLLQLPEVASAHGAMLRTRAQDYGPQVRARIEFGHFIHAADHQTALRARGTMLRGFLQEAFGQADALILPVFADPLPTIAELDLADGAALMPKIARVIHFTRPINYLGLPTVTLPYQRNDGELPNGFQLVGRPFGEAALLRLAAAYERQVPVEIAPLP